MQCACGIFRWQRSSPTGCGCGRIWRRCGNPRRRGAGAEKRKVFDGGSAARGGAAGTQNQALKALRLFYKSVLRVPVGKLEGVRAGVDKRARSWLRVEGGKLRGWRGELAAECSKVVALGSKLAAGGSEVVAGGSEVAAGGSEVITTYCEVVAAYCEVVAGGSGVAALFKHLVLQAVLLLHHGRQRVWNMRQPYQSFWQRCGDGVFPVRHPSFIARRHFSALRHRVGRVR